MDTKTPAGGKKPQKPKPEIKESAVDTPANVQAFIDDLPTHAQPPAGWSWQKSKSYVLKGELSRVGVWIDKKKCHVYYCKEAPVVCHATVAKNFALGIGFGIDIVAALNLAEAACGGFIS